MSKLEQEFRKAVNLATPKIQKHLQKAVEEFKKARQISEESGVPFESQLGHYIPFSFNKWDLDVPLIETIMREKYEYWTYSSVCY